MLRCGVGAKECWSSFVRVRVCGVCGTVGKGQRRKGGGG